MKITIITFTIGAIFFLTGCAGKENNENADVAVLENNELEVVKPLTIDDSLKYSNSSELLILQTQQALVKELKERLETKGVSDALTYCNLNALGITKRYNKDSTLVDIKRTSLKIRNQKNKADTIELEYLVNFEKDFQANRALDTKMLLTNEHVHYFKPILIKGLCLSCHGRVGIDLDADRYRMINSIYPGDNATGFQLGQVRGMWHVKIKR